MTRVCVIIPCYRDAATLGRAIDSVIAQTKSVDETIVVNDYSPESEAIERVLIGYPFVVYIKNPENIGLAASRNVGARIADSQILTFLDADDELHPQKIEIQLSQYRPELAVSCRVRQQWAEELIPPYEKFSPGFDVLKFSDSRSIINRNILTGASIMIRKEALLNMGGYDEGLRSCEDFDLWLRILDAGIRVLDVQLPLYIYWQNINGLSKNYLQISGWELQVLKRYFTRHGDEDISSMQNAMTLMIWILKHIYRYEESGDEALRSNIDESIKILAAHPVLIVVIKAIKKLRLIRPVVYINDKLRLGL